MLDEARVQINRQIQILCRDIKNLDCLQSENFAIDKSKCFVSEKLLVMDLIIERIMRERDQLEDIIDDIDGLIRKYN